MLPRRLFIALWMALFPSAAYSYPIIFGTTLDPDPPLASDPLSLIVAGVANSSGFFLAPPYDVVIGASNVDVDFFLSSPAPGELTMAVLTSFQDSVSLGTLAEGDYGLTVNLFTIQRQTGAVALADVHTSSFTVVPEPASMQLLVLALGATVLARWRRARSS